MKNIHNSRKVMRFAMRFFAALRMTGKTKSISADVGFSWQVLCTGLSILNPIGTESPQGA